MVISAGLLVVGLVSAFALAYANGANDVSKAIATLVGTGVTDYKRAIWWGAGWTTVGALLAGAVATAMLATFTTGLLATGARLTDTAALAMVLGALLWVFLATRYSMPVSTTHAITGAIVLTGAVAVGPSEVVWSGLMSKILVPLLASPVITLGLGLVVYGLVRVALARVPLSGLHWLSSGAASLARGLNDTPKIAALGVTSLAIHQSLDGRTQTLAFLGVALCMGLGSLLGGRKVAETLAEKVTKLDHQEGLAANLTTAVLVATSANLGLPVSTTHVSSSAIIGIGLRKGLGAVTWKVVRDMSLAWVVTLPLAGVLAVGCYLALTAVAAQPWLGAAAAAAALGVAVWRRASSPRVTPARVGARAWAWQRAGSRAGCGPS